MVGSSASYLEVVSFGEGEEVKDVGVFEGLLSEVGLCGREGGGKVGGGGAFTGEEVAFDLVEEDGAAPAVDTGLADVIEGFSVRGALGDDGDIVPPRDGGDRRDYGRR